MGDSSERRREWAFRLIRRLDPGYRHRWEIVDGIVAGLTGPDSRWLDGGCGTNLAVEEFPSALNVGIDIHRHPSLRRIPGAWFAQGGLDRMPFRDGTFTLVTLNTVAEHLADPAATFREIRRVLVPGGHVLVHTTNIGSPLILFGKIIPHSLRRAVFTRVFGAADDDIFPAVHRVNTARALSRMEGFEVGELHRIQDLNRSGRAIFLFFLCWHMLSRLPGLAWLRTNIVVLLRKTGGE
jgi:SAM-dependent methyltransferase